MKDGAASNLGGGSCATVVPPPVPASCRQPGDSIVHAGAPPTVATVEAWEFAARLDELEDRGERSLHANRDSASWLGSLTFHLVVILLLWFLFSPADFGGSPLQIYLSLNHHDQQLEEETLFVAVPQIESALDPSHLDDIVPVDPAEFVAPSSGAEGASADPSGGDQGGDDGGPNGSFFGIEAVGHEFVYVLDMSGSMEGRRYERATAELIRSVGALRKTQKFYVVLYDDSAVQMFGRSSLHPTPIAATVENKEKLAQWLPSAFGGGGTDPRDAVRLALRMNPSAIFMLSDGKFNGQRRQKRKDVIGGNPDTFAVIAAASDDAPIHSIAFENTQTCENMKRIAEMTGGIYRFVGVADKESLTLARAALARGDKAAAEIELRSIVEKFGHTENEWQALQELTTILSERANQALQNGQLEVVREPLLTIVKLDPQRIVSEEMQATVISKLLEQAPLSSGAENETPAISILDEVVRRYPASRAAQQIVAPVADELLKQARELAANEEYGLAINKLEDVLARYAHTLAAEQCRLERKQITALLLDQAQQLRDAEDDAASATYLRDLIDSVNSSHVQKAAADALKELIVEMLTKARDANFRRDRVASVDANQQLEGLAADPLFLELRRDFQRKERGARDLLRRAQRLERGSTRNSAIQAYRKVVDVHRGTLAAQKAQSRLQALGISRDADGPLADGSLPTGMDAALFDIAPQ